MSKFLVLAFLLSGHLSACAAEGVQQSVGAVFPLVGGSYVVADAAGPQLPKRPWLAPPSLAAAQSSTDGPSPYEGLGVGWNITAAELRPPGPSSAGWEMGAGVEARIAWPIEGTVAEFVLGYQVIRVAEAHGSEGLDAAVDADRGGPCIGLAFGF